jgi:transcriptional regulator with XRE-family HTH domain
MVNRELGARLRTARRGRGLALIDVEMQSGGEFRASVVGAYERGERTLSVTRMMRLAEFYGVDPSELLDGLRWTAGDGDLVEDAVGPVEIDLTTEDVVVISPERAPEPGSPALTVDLVQLEELVQLERSPRSLVHSFVQQILRRRRQPVSRSQVTIRADDAKVLALALGLAPSELGQLAFGALAATGQLDAGSGTRP